VQDDVVKLLLDGLELTELEQLGKLQVLTQVPLEQVCPEEHLDEPHPL